MHVYTVYILRCADGSYYTGLTSALAQRMAEHQSGVYHTCYTYARRPLYLVYTSEFSNVFQAIDWERKIKRWSRKKKQALIAGAYEMLPGLASPKCMRIAMVRQAHHDKIYQLVRFPLLINCLGNG